MHGGQVAEQVVEAEGPGTQAAAHSRLVGMGDGKVTQQLHGGAARYPDRVKEQIG